MSEYKIYVIGADGEFVRTINLECDSDAAAIESTKRFMDGYELELWEGDRQISKFHIT